MCAACAGTQAAGARLRAVCAVEPGGARLVAQTAHPTLGARALASQRVTLSAVLTLAVVRTVRTKLARVTTYATKTFDL